MNILNMDLKNPPPGVSPSSSTGAGWLDMLKKGPAKKTGLYQTDFNPEVARRRREQATAETATFTVPFKREAAAETQTAPSPLVAQRVRGFQGAMFPQTKPSTGENYWKRQQEEKHRQFLERVPGGGINGANIARRMREKGLDV